MLSRIITLFILCSLMSWVCLPYSPPTPITVHTNTIPQPSNAYNGIGLWVEDGDFIGMTEWDTGYCGNDLSGGYGGVGGFTSPVSPLIFAGNKLFRINHTGIDLKGTVGQSVVAAGQGRVVYAGWSTYSLGNTIVIAHGYNWFTYYGHLNTTTVGCYQSVGRGQLIGSVGQSGQASCPHLHFELRNGRIAYDPYNYLPSAIIESSLCE